MTSESFKYRYDVVYRLKNECPPTSMYHEDAFGVLKPAGFEYKNGYRTPDDCVFYFKNAKDAKSFNNSSGHDSVDRNTGRCGSGNYVNLIWEEVTKSPTIEKDIWAL